MKLNQFNSRCPCILPFNGKYYLYYETSALRGNNIDIAVSDDLKEWTKCNYKIKPNPLFSPEGLFVSTSIIHHNNKFYLTSSYRIEGAVKSVYIFSSDTPDGEFVLHSDIPLTPPEWECIGGSIYFDKKENPYLVFSHEWIQVDDGSVYYLPLSKDLKTAISEPKKMFSASEHKSVLSISREKGCYVADAPFLYVASDNTLNCFWSTFTTNGYTVLVAKSDNGDIDGNWKMLEKPFATVNGGYGMVFKDFSGKPHYVMHKPNVAFCEKSIIFDFVENESEINIVE